MNTALSTSSSNTGALRAILWGGFICGILDITAAFVVYGFFGARPLPLLQGIAFGLIGSRAFGGSLTTVALGLLCHFFIAFCAAAVYVGLSHIFSFLIRHAVLAGALYGIAV